MVGKSKKKGALQDKGVRQFKKIHLEDEGVLQEEVVLQFKKNPMTEFHQLLPKQVTKGTLLSAVEVKKRRCFANVTGATSSLAIYQI
jgi:hypothetical protein